MMMQRARAGLRFRRRVGAAGGDSADRASLRERGSMISFASVKARGPSRETRPQS